MKDRLITASGAVAALLIVYVLFFQSTAVPVTRPVTTETGRNGYSAVAAWLSGADVRVASLRRRFDRLIGRGVARGEPPFPRRGNVLITTMPHLIPVRSSEHESLKAWLRSGNTLLLLAALDDTPEWTPDSAAGRFIDDLRVMAGTGFSVHDGSRSDDGSASARIPAQTRITLEPVPGHPLMDGVGALHGFSDAESDLWQPATGGAAGPPLMLELAVEHRTGIGAVWQRRYGSGHIIVAASGTLLTNHVVADSDAGRFLSNVLRHHLDADAAVIFDDMHQGLSAIYDPAAFYNDPRLHYTVAFLVAAWLVYLLGSSNRLAPPLPASSSPRQRDFLEALGGFMARRLDRRDAGLEMMEVWFDEVRRARGIRGREPPWAELEQTPALERATVERLRRCHERLTAGQPVDLVRLHNMLTSAREAIG